MNIAFRKGEALFGKAGKGIERKDAFYQRLSAYMLAQSMKDPELSMHSCRVQSLASHLAKALFLSKRERAIIGLAALLHDLGKLVLPDSLLQKASPLTPEEFGLIKLHPIYGALLLTQAQGLGDVAFLVYHHHEHWDGSGYPLGLRGEAIPLGARILAIADAFEAMTSHRPYQRRRTTEEALVELRRYAGTQFDPTLVHHFCSGLEEGFLEQRQPETNADFSRLFSSLYTRLAPLEAGCWSPGGPFPPDLLALDVSLPHRRH
jgi:HD-GYP domain-containing protein (c-di-GMP phosphodiesterase class II)